VAVGTFANSPHRGELAYSGHPLACAAAAIIEAMRAEGIVDNTARIGEAVLGPGLAPLAEQHAGVGEVRGTGVFWAVELVRDKVSGQLAVVGQHYER
jgi:taurine--2-oxoglutarate transaminase